MAAIETGVRPGGGRRDVKEISRGTWIRGPVIIGVDMGQTSAGIAAKDKERNALRSSRKLELSPTGKSLMESFAGKAW